MKASARLTEFAIRQVATIEYSTEMIAGGVECILTGWGFTTAREDRPLPNDLQRISLSTITNSECNTEDSYADETAICTQAPPGRGSCTVRVM